MSEIPAEAVQAAARVLAAREFDDKTFEGYARAVLEAAAPFIAEHIARQLVPVWEWTREVAAAHHTTYGVDAVGRCMRIAREAFTAGDDDA